MENKKKYLVIKTEKHELRKKFFSVKTPCDLEGLRLLIKPKRLLAKCSYPTMSDPLPYLKNKEFKPSPIAPGGLYQKEWFDKLIRVSGSGVNDMLTHRVYNLLPGSEEHIEDKILDPTRLSKLESIFSNLSETIRKHL
ncbi:glycoside hydrolase family 79 amino-terminal domain protein [Medicago truncatula]|uniref:Glycoside hydrolase family 79 amino-terminal domain protein n=1 Tax=Medicago truncatula TaxID=3880 RepID=A0A072UQ89_MEDTR|nr:glycoside hydrolase family 79 amino-terminal domain protein [Medicago truncatula]